MFVSSKTKEKCSLSPSHLSTPTKFARNRKTKFGNKKIKSKSLSRVSERENNIERLEIIDKNKNNHEKFSFCLCVFFDTAKKNVLQQKSFSIESAFESFSEGTTTIQPRLDCVCAFLPIFHSAGTKKLRRRCVWQPENVYNHLKYITVEYKRHYANRTYFCHFPS